MGHNAMNPFAGIIDTLRECNRIAARQEGESGMPDLHGNGPASERANRKPISGNSPTNSREYRCFTCGEHKPMTWENEVGYFDEGEWISELVCDDCRQRGRHKLLP